MTNHHRLPPPEDPDDWPAWHLRQTGMDLRDAYDVVRALDAGRPVEVTPERRIVATLAARLIAALLGSEPPSLGPGTSTGHGHVWERPDGVRARCGGTGLCPVCRADAILWPPG